ncbi:Bug family tripartite tricarboxylate transporter substrate binding protein [Lutibaculum baratangense]|nr:tripartite tricarboxylate transporter substrate binding protein [Lutibaculum baratangense]
MKRALGLAAAAAMALAAGQAAAQDWPKGDVQLIIPSGPGGGFDTYARVLARAMEEDLDVKVVPQNVTGGGGLRGATVAYQAKPDGQTFAVFNVPGIIEPVINGESVAYDVSEIDWLGAMAFNQYVVVVGKDSPYDTIEDMKAAGEPITFTAYGSSGVAANRILCAEVGLECEIITGYPSNSEALLGVVRGDAIASVPPISTATAFNAKGDLKAILLMTERETPEFPDTEKAADAGYANLANLGLIRAFGLPPGVPAETRAAVQAAFDKALEAESVKTWAEDTGSAFEAMSGDELSALIESQTELLTRYKDVIAGN